MPTVNNRGRLFWRGNGRCESTGRFFCEVGLACSATIVRM